MMMRAIGLMSGTSLDGVDAAIIETDGEHTLHTGTSLTFPYAPEFRAVLRGILEGKGDAQAIERQLTSIHVEAVNTVLRQANLQAKDINVIGFHGQTIVHRPSEGITWQIGDGSLLAEKTGIDVVCDFRRRDMAAGGQGAPLVPIYHVVATHGHEKPIAIINLGGVANITWIGPNAPADMLAFDTGPGNALLDDWMITHTGQAYDADGLLSAQGKIHQPTLKAFLADSYFTQIPPKSLDRNHFKRYVDNSLTPEDGAATLVAFTVESIAMAAQHFPSPAKYIYVAGGGRHNSHLMEHLSLRLQAPVASIDVLNIDGDALEAQAFGYLAVRSVQGKPLSFPGTTGVKYPVTGGALYRK